MKRILIVSTVSRQFYLFERSNIKVLRDLGYEIHGAANYSDSNERLEALNIIRHPFDIQRSPFSINNMRAYRQLKQIMIEGQFDVVHCHSPMGGVLARIAAKSVGVKRVIYTAHGFHFYKGAPLINWILYYPIEKLLSRFTDILITINKEDFLAAKKFGKCRVEYVPGIGVDVDKSKQAVKRDIIRKELGIGDKDIVIVSVGEMNKNKNHSLGISAISLLRNKSVKYIICGRGNREKELKRKAESLGIQDQVLFLGYSNNVREILQSADIFLFPSLREGLSVSLMEAMAEGLPIIASDIRGNRDLVIHNEGGYLHQPRDVEGFSRCLTTLIQDKEIREKMGHRNREVIRNFDEAIVRNRMNELYKNEE